MWNRRVSTIVLAMATTLGLASPAGAVVFIGLQHADENGGAIAEVASGAGVATFDGPYGTFTTNFVSVVGSPTTLNLLDSASLNISSGIPGTLMIYVTATDNVLPSTSADFLSGFTSNSLPAGWSATLQTYVDPGNGIFATTTLLGSDIFDGLRADVDNTIANAGPGPFSVTGVYTIAAAGLGSALSTIHLSGAAIPITEPASVALLGAILLGFGALRHLRNTV